MLLAITGAVYFMVQNSTYAASTSMEEPKIGACVNSNGKTNSVAANNIINGIWRLTYECFGATGNGGTNDAVAIKRAHDFANKEYINKGRYFTVYGTSGKTYYIGKASPITVLTDTDWRGANFIIDDYVRGKNGGNEVSVTQNVFVVTSPMKLATNSQLKKYSKDNGSSAFVNRIGSFLLKSESNSGNIASEIIKYVTNDSGINQKMRKYLNGSTKRWLVIFEASSGGNNVYKRLGPNANSGSVKRDVMLLDVTNKKFLSSFMWDYENLASISIVPLPNKTLTIQNGNFLTRTNNIVYNASGSRTKYAERNILVNYGGNVKFSNINHTLDETAHRHDKNNGLYNKQKVDTANQYNGFFKVKYAASVLYDNCSVTSHTPSYLDGKDTTDRIGTYDIRLENSVAITLNNVKHTRSNNGENPLTVPYTSKWGVMASFNAKDLVVTSSSLDRIDAHEGIYNLYLANSTIGSKGLRLIGKGTAFIDNVSFTEPNEVVSLRRDYGSSWEGTIFLNNIKWSLPNDANRHSVIAAVNDDCWRFGNTTYFPKVFINGLTINGKNANNADRQNIFYLDSRKTQESTKQNYNVSAATIYRLNTDAYIGNITYNAKGKLGILDSDNTAIPDSLKNRSAGGVSNGVLRIHYLNNNTIVDVTTQRGKNYFNQVSASERRFSIDKNVSNNITNKLSEMNNSYVPSIKNNVKLLDTGAEATIERFTLKNGASMSRAFNQSIFKYDVNAVQKTTQGELILSSNAAHVISKGGSVSVNGSKATFKVTLAPNETKTLTLTVVSVDGVSKDYVFTFRRIK